MKKSLQFLDLRPEVENYTKSIAKSPPWDHTGDERSYLPKSFSLNMKYEAKCTESQQTCSLIPFC